MRPFPCIRSLSKDRVEVSLKSKAGLARYVAHACQMLDVSVPDLFQREPVKFAKATEALTTRQTALSAAEDEWLMLEEKAESASAL